VSRNYQLRNAPKAPTEKILKTVLATATRSTACLSPVDFLERRFSPLPLHPSHFSKFDNDSVVS